MNQIASLILAFAVVCFNTATASDSTAIFKRDVQPFLQEHCYACHDARDSGREDPSRRRRRQAQMVDESGHMVQRGMGLLHRKN